MSEIKYSSVMSGLFASQRTKMSSFSIEYISLNLLITFNIDCIRVFPPEVILMSLLEVSPISFDMLSMKRSSSSSKIEITIPLNKFDSWAVFSVIENSVEPASVSSCFENLQSHISHQIPRPIFHKTLSLFIHPN